MEVEAKKALNKIDKLLTKASNFGAVLNQIGEHLVSEVDLNFRDASDPYGDPWAPLKHRVGKPLNDTKVLANSTTYFVSFDPAVEVGTNLPYAATHQYGAKKGDYGSGIPWGDIPARPSLPTEEKGIPEPWADDIVDIIISHFD